MQEAVNGRFGEYGGQYIPETLMNAVLETEAAYNKYKDVELHHLQTQSKRIMSLKYGSLFL